MNAVLYYAQQVFENVFKIFFFTLLFYYFSCSNTDKNQYVRIYDRHSDSKLVCFSVEVLGLPHKCNACSSNLSWVSFILQPSIH